VNTSDDDPISSSVPGLQHELAYHRWSRSAGPSLERQCGFLQRVVVKFARRPVLDMWSASVCSIRSPNKAASSDLRGGVCILAGISSDQRRPKWQPGGASVHQQSPGLLHECVRGAALSARLSSPVTDLIRENGKFAVVVKPRRGQDAFQRRSWSSAAGAYRVT